MPNASMMSLAVLLAVSLAGCNYPNFDPSKAVAPYPFELHTTNTLPIQAFRNGQSLEIVNSTDHHWQGATLWVNQQYMLPMPTLAPGKRIVLNLHEFRDDLGESFNAGGIFRTREPTPVELVEVQPGEGQPLVGLIAIRGGE